MRIIFRKNYYNNGAPAAGEFMQDNFDCLNSLGNLQNDELTLSMYF
jgi:hypothetical protein